MNLLAKIIQAWNPRPPYSPGAGHISCAVSVATWDTRPGGIRRGVLGVTAPLKLGHDGIFPENFGDGLFQPSMLLGMLAAAAGF